LTTAGEQLPILKSVTRVRYLNKEHLLEAFFDISERIRMWQELRQAHAELDQIFQTASVAMRLVDLDFTVLKVNRTYEILTGVKDAYAVGKKCHEIFPGSTCRTEWCPILRVRNGEERIVDFQVTKTLPDGKGIDCLLDATPFAGPDGETIGIVESFRDITELKKARNVIVAERDKLDQILFHLQEGVGIINKDHRLEYRNGVFVDYFGNNPTRKCYEAVYGKPRSCDPCLMRQAFETGRVQRTEQKIPEGKSYEITYTPVTDIDGSQKVVGLWRDVTEKEIAVSAMLRSEQLAALGELAAGVAHEINNPINGIINYAQILFNGSEEGSMVRDIAGRVITEGDRIDRIVEGLLSFARRRKDDKSVVSVEDVLSDALSLNAAQLRKDNIKVIRHVPQRLPRLWAQPQEIAQVFINVISNARHALNEKYPRSHEDKILEITAEQMTSGKDVLVRICFRDHGIGIPAEILDKVMIPFFSTKDERKRTGLGLSISQSIVEEHGGRIFLESEAGRYTNVAIELPLPQLHLNLQSIT
jgi:PAS domain S-box-containing protein